MSTANEQLHAENKALQAQRIAHTEEISRIQAEMRTKELSDRTRTDESHSQAMALAASRHETALKQLAAANEQLQEENKSLQGQHKGDQLGNQRFSAATEQLPAEPHDQ